MKVVPIDDGAVTPFDGGEGKINLSDLNPDLNNDGHVDDWEQQLFDRLQEADSDGSGSVSRLELFGVLKSMLGEVQEAKRAGGEIPIASLNPDTDGDGQVEVWETECYEKIKAADADGSGNISVKELFEVIKRSSDEVKEAQKGGIPISTLNPDTDGDGKVEKWEVDVFERIKAADEDKSGSINVKELFGVIKGAAESDRQKKLFRKLFIIACVLLVVMLIANMGLTMAVVFFAKDMAVAGDGKQVAKNGHIVQTGTLEEVITLSASSTIFEELVVDSDVLRTRPSSIVVDFKDGSMVQFPPLQIQIFSASALMANLQIGVKISLKQNELPVFEFTNSPAQLQEAALPSGAAAATAAAAASPALSAISAIKIIRKLGGMESKPIGRRRLEESGEVAGLADEGEAIPKSSAQLTRDTLAAVAEAVKGGGKIPLVEDPEEAGAKPVDDSEPAEWIIEVDSDAEVGALCESLASFGANCIDAPEASSNFVNTDFVTVRASKMDMQAFRDSASGTSAPVGVKTIIKELSVGTTIAGLVRRPSASMKLRHDAPHPIHLQMRKSVRRQLQRTPAGHRVAHRKLRRMLSDQRVPEHHRRRLGYGDEDFFYQRPDVGAGPVVNVDCYDDQNPGAYAGTVDSPGDGTHPCADWASAAAAFGVTADAAGLCSIWGAPPLPTFTATLEGIQPRVPCEGFLGEAPWCFLDKGGGSWGATTMPSKLTSCTGLFIEELNRAYTPGHASTDTTKTPIKPDWYWGVDRVKQQEAVYDTDPNALLFDGSGVHVFVIDTGVNLNHEEFAGRVGTSYRAYSVGDEGPVECDPSDVSKCIDVDGHGTHCASTILGAKAGVAPAAILHSVGVFDPALRPSAAPADFSAGLRWIVDYYERELKPNGIPAIVSASMAGPGSAASDLKWKLPAEAGILTLAAAGNDDSDACGVSPARLGGVADDLQLPHLTIGASNVDDSKALFSNWGTCVSMWAPGTGILAARHDSDTLMTVMSGTSMATPIAAGVATLAMEVAGDASKQSYSHMTAQDGINVRNWMLFNALNDKLTAIAPASIVPVSFVQTLIDEEGASSYVVKHFKTCAEGDATCEVELSDEQLNVATSPNLMAHIPDYMQDTANVATPLTCAAYAEPKYVEECPPPGTQVCGEPTKTLDDGSVVYRPYRKKIETCTFGCVCDGGAIKETIEPCAVAATDYRYTNRACAPVYQIDADAQPPETLSGHALTWSPLTGGEGYELTDVTEDVGIDTSCIGVKSTTYDWNQPYTATFSTDKYEMTDDGVRYFGTTYSAAFEFYGKTYHEVSLFNNGHLCFGRSGYWASSFKTFEDHFDPNKGPCFSFLLVDMETTTVEVCKRVVYDNGWGAKSQTFTFSKAALFGSGFTGEEKPKVTVQVELLFGTNQIVVRYGDLHPSVSAFVGPSNGTGVAPGFLSDMPKLPIPSA